MKRAERTKNAGKDTEKIYFNRLGAGCRRFESCHSDHDGVTRKMSHHFFSIHVLFSVIIDGWVEVDIRRNCHCIDTRHNISGSTALSDMVNYGK